MNRLVNTFGEAMEREAPTMIVTFAEPIYPDVVSDVASLLAAAELRVDLLKSDNPEYIASQVKMLGVLPLLVTIRSEAEAEGGGWKDSKPSKTKRRSLLRELSSMPEVNAVDVDLSDGESTEMIDDVHDQNKLAFGSVHFRNTPSNSELEDRIADALEADADWAKLAVTIRSEADWERFKAFGQSFSGEDIVLSAMGNDPEYRWRMVENGSKAVYSSASNTAVALGQMYYRVSHQGFMERNVDYAEFQYLHQVQ